MNVMARDLRTLAAEAFVYFYPLVTMEVTRLQQTMPDPSGDRATGAPSNRFFHLRQYPDADFRAVVRPNFDTLYSIAFLDLTGGPVSISVPDVGDRYYLLPMLDMWTDVFANPGTRTSGNGPQRFLIVPSGYDGGVPADTTVIEAPTPYVWVIGRVQTNGPPDYEAANSFQDGLHIEAAGDATEPSEGIAGVTPATEALAFVNALTAAEFLDIAARLLSVNPPHATDHSQLFRLRDLGITGDGHWDAERFTAEERAEIQAGFTDALTALPALLARVGSQANGWSYQTDTMGVYGNFYLKRALVTMAGLGANPPEDAIYPVLLADSDGEPLTGETDYRIHFSVDEIPPVGAFWSITMYDEEGFQAANELDRFALGDRDDLHYNEDGSLDIYLQHGNPGPERQPNWLPAPLGPLGVTMRLYAPEPAALDGSWKPPQVVKA